jgi:DNA polymerase-3 subunit delta'
MHLWLQETWRRLVALGERMPHALLFVGPAGTGKRDLADALAAALLCARPTQDGHACGHCAPCVLRQSGNHPDLHLLVPAAQLASPEGAPVEEGGKAKSSQIVIEQVRDLQAALGVTAHQGSGRVVIVEPAEAMNTFTANALLKSLEEPPQACTFVLCCSAPRMLLPTIRSRCQTWAISPPDETALRAWAAGKPPELLALAHAGGGMPLAAERLAARGMTPHLIRFVRDIGALSDSDPLMLAGQWENWLKSKEASAAGFDLVQLVEWVQRWVSDLASVRLGGRVRYFPDQEGLLSAVALRTDVDAMATCYNELARIRRVARHPLNSRLMLEDMLLRFARAIGGSKK